MSSSSTEFLRALPKCEHHMHIEGSLEPNLLFDLCKANSIKLDPEFYSTIEVLEKRYENFANLDDFLNYYNMAMACLITHSDFSALAFAYMQRASADGVKHAEVFFDPQAHTGRGVALDVVVNGLTEGLRKGEAEFGMTTKLIMCFVKHLPVSSALEAVEATAPFVHSGEVAGLGMDSTEINNPPEKFADVYTKGKELGFKNLTAHVGEEGPAQSVRTAVQDMGIHRIDHGIHAADDPELLKVLAEKNVFLTVCPLSNVRLRCVTSVSEVPIPKFMEAGVKFSINSDDPAYFGGYILDNYIAVHAAFQFSKETWKGLMADSINGSWCDAARKQELLAVLDGVMTEWEGRSI
ncbi:adenine deaminase [Meredithblackwellia eburnea MCA 4105]